jgi:hypothetical protein
VRSAHSQDLNDWAAVRIVLIGYVFVFREQQQNKFVVLACFSLAGEAGAV